MQYTISGTIMQTVAIDLLPGETVYSQTNSMCWMTDTIAMNTHTGGGFLAGLSRSLGGGSFFITEFTAQAPGHVAFAPRFPGTIMPIPLGPGQSVVCRKETFLVAEKTVTLEIAWQQRLGFAVVPPPLVPAFVRARTLTDRGTDGFTQAILAEFMRAGLLGPHIRRMRTEYARRRAALLTAFGKHVRLATPLAAPGGLHMVARLRQDLDEAAAVHACRARDLAVSPLRAYYAGTPRMSGLVVGFAATPPALAADVARRLEAALNSVVTPSVSGVAIASA